MPPDLGGGRLVPLTLLARLVGRGGARGQVRAALPCSVLCMQPCSWYVAGARGIQVARDPFRLMRSRSWQELGALLSCWSAVRQSVGGGRHSALPWSEPRARPVAWSRAPRPRPRFPPWDLSSASGLHQFALETGVPCIHGSEWSLGKVGAVGGVAPPLLQNHSCEVTVAGTGVSLTLLVPGRAWHLPSATCSGPQPGGPSMSLSPPHLAPFAGQWTRGGLGA